MNTNKPKKTTRKKNSSESELIRLNKFIADAGYCSRRKADELISAGVVKVNGAVVTELGAKV
ncbi:MAG TPA: S4 domain-containing protein, partial [Candidatus Kapabacteria bacterium]|nr:S4 domain-containing protein [Candidatus Kapabacteria bacterium]